MKEKLAKTHYNGEGYDEISSPDKKHLDRKRASFVNNYIKFDSAQSPSKLRTSMG